MQESNVYIFCEKNNSIRVPKDQIKFPIETNLPAICFFNEEKNVGVAVDFLSHFNEYVVSIDKEKIFSYTLFDDGDLPDKVGCDLFITADGKLTKTKASNKRIGMFLAKKEQCILFKLD